MKDTEFTKGKVAYKSIEYSAAALPIVASLFGLSPHLENEKDVLIANNIDEWGNQLIRLINDESLRRKIGVNARIKAEKYHSINSTYKKFLEILLEENQKPINKL